MSILTWICCIVCPHQSVYEYADKTCQEDLQAKWIGPHETVGWRTCAHCGRLYRVNIVHATRGRPLIYVTR